MGSEVLPQLGGSEEPRQVSFEDDGVPESWEMADLEESMKKLLAPSLTGLDVDQEDCCPDKKPVVVVASLAENGGAVGKGAEEVDTFLREALQRSRDRLTVLRLEQEVEKFMRNPKQHQLDFQPMPSSYLRLVAHRVAQHYHLQSVVVDSNTPESTRIIARKTLESRLPTVRLADIPVDSQEEEDLAPLPSVKVAIKQRPHRGLRTDEDVNGSGELAVRMNHSKSVEERKEEYNKARARIFSSSDLLSKVTEDEYVDLENTQTVESFSIGTEKFEDKSISGEPSEMNIPGGLADGVDMIFNEKRDRDYAFRVKGNPNRVAIFRDREKDRKDPDYDRSYDRYAQRFDPGFGLSPGPFSMHAMYTPVSNYNTEFPQLTGPLRPQIHMEPPHTAAAYVRGPWPGSSNPIGYRPLDSVMGPFNPGHMGPHSGSAMYLPPPQFSCPGPSMTYVHPQQRFQQSLAQPHLHPNASFSQARRR